MHTPKRSGERHNNVNTVRMRQSARISFHVIPGYDLRHKQSVFSTGVLNRFQAYLLGTRKDSYKDNCTLFEDSLGICVFMVVICFIVSGVKW